MFIFFLSAGRHVELTLRHRNLQTATALARMLPEWAERKSASSWNVVPGMDLIPGDLVRVDATAGTLDVLEADFDARDAASPDLSANETGMGRELFAVFRNNCGLAQDGASAIL